MKLTSVGKGIIKFETSDCEIHFAYDGEEWGAYAVLPRTISSSFGNPTTAKAKMVERLRKAADELEVLNIQPIMELL